MLLSIPPRPRSRPRLIPGLSLCGGDLIAGRYRVLSLLKADRACAYLAGVQSGTNARVEIEILLAMEDDIEAVHLRYLADARKAAVLQGPHVERVLHVGVTADGHPFVVREPQTGQTLAALLADVGSLPTESAVEIAIAMCDALESAHAHGIVHGELEPGVVHVTWSPDGPSSVKLAGLGTSRALAMLPLDTRALAALATRAPELLQLEREIDGRVDVWGVGVVLYTMLAGAPPFAADSPSNLNLSVALDEPALLAGVPDGLGEIVDACLARDPTLRPQSVTSLAARLAAFSPNPLSVKRHSLLVLDTGRYEALVLERLVKEARPESTPPPPAPADEEPVLDLVPTARLRIASDAPVALSLAPIAGRLDPKVASRRWGRVVMVAAASICLAAGAFAASALQNASATPTRAGATQAAPPAAMNVPPNAPNARNARNARNAPNAPNAANDASKSVAPAIAVTDLPAKTAPRAPPPRPGTRGSRSAAAPVAPPAGPAAKLAAAEAASAEDPIVRSASAPIQIQPKAPDDDLRRFLDDRR